MIVTTFTQNSKDYENFAIWDVEDMDAFFDALSDEGALFDELANCDDWLPDGVCDAIGVPTGSSYADAVQLFRSEWLAK